MHRPILKTLPTTSKPKATAKTLAEVSRVFSI